MLIENPLTISLEELGLSKYEASVYYTLISRGEATGSELAYYAEIPRTKIYPTLLKLEKKKLARISKRKPIMCIAISPEDAFDSIIHEQINKVNSMNSLVTDLKKINEKSKKTRGSEEKQFFQFSANNTLDQLRLLIDDAQFSISLMVDENGLNLLAACKEQLLSALTRGIKIKMIVPSSQINSESFNIIPNGITIRMQDTYQNYCVFDESKVLLIDTDTGKGESYSTSEILGKKQSSDFSEVWKKSLKTDSLEGKTSQEIHEINEMIKTIDSQGLYHILNSSFNSKNIQFDLLSLLDSRGINLKSKDLKKIIGIINSVLHITCSGNVEFDKNNKTITIESKVNRGHSLPWGTILESYLRENGHNPMMIYQKKSSDGEKIHIKINSK